MKETAKRLLSMALVLVMVLSQLPATAMAAGNTESEGSTTTPSVADAFGFKTDPPAGYDATDGIHPFSHSGTKDTINLIPVKEVGLLTASRPYSTYNSSINVYNFGADNLADFSDGAKLFDTKSSSFTPTDEIIEGDDTAYLFRLASGVAYDPTGSGRDDHVFYYGADASIQHNYSKFDWNYLLMQDFSYEGGEEKAVVSGRLDPNEGNSEKNRAYDWATSASVVDEAPDKYLSVTAGNFNGNGKETVVLYDPQFGNFTLRECTVNGESIETSLVFDLGNEVTVYGLNTHVTYTLNDAVTTIRSQYGRIFPKFMPLVHLTAGDLDGDEKDELVVTVTPLYYKSGSAYMVESASWIFILNKENDGEGNAVWTVKASKVFNDEGASVKGAAAVIGDFNNDNKNELVLVSDLKLIMMQYSSGQLTSLGETIIAYFSDNGVMPKDSDTAPIYSVPSVGAVRFGGTGTSPYLFISDKFWRYDNEDGTFYKAYEVSTSITYSGDPIRRQPIIGNFDGNIAGKEQLFTAVRGTAGNGENRYVIECFSVGGGDSRLLYSYTESDADALGRMVLTAPDADADDGMVMRYTGKDYVYSNPNVMAILQASPYFEDLLGDYERLGATGYGTSTGTGSTYSNTVSSTVTYYFTASYSLQICYVPVASAEYREAFSDIWSRTNETSHTYETSISFETGSLSNQVVMISTPVILYHYDVLGTDGEPIAPYDIGMSQEPCYSMLPVEDYNASAELLGIPVIDNSSVIGVVPGQPQTYPSSTGQIDSCGGVHVPIDTPVQVVQGNSVAFQEVSWEDSQSLTQSYSFEDEYGGGAGVACFLIGRNNITSEGYAVTECVTSGVSRSGCVANVPVGNPDYSFKWQFATWDILVGNGQRQYKVPVLGYLVSGVSQPPSVPRNLTATPDTDSVTLEWEPGYNSAVKYDIFRYYPEEKEDYQYDLIGTVDGSETSFVCEGLDANTRYYFSIRAVGDRGLRSTYAEPVAVTTISPGQSLPQIQEQPVDRTINLANTRKTTFSTLAKPTSDGTVSYAWEYRDGIGSSWERITSGPYVDGYNTRTLTQSNIIQSMDGAQYRCRISERSGAPSPAVVYTRTATLTVGKSNTTTNLLSPSDTSSGIRERMVTLEASVVASDNQACNGNVSFQITNTATGEVTTLMAAEAAGGKATTDWTPLDTGVYTIKAVYIGDDTTEPSTSNTVTYYVQENKESPCYEITLSGDLVWGETITPSLKAWSNGQSTAATAEAFELYKYNGTEFEFMTKSWDQVSLLPGEYRVDARLEDQVVTRKVFTVSKRPITITAPSIPAIVEGDTLDLGQYIDQIRYSYDLEEAFKALFKLSGVSAEQPLSGQYEISVVYANPDDPMVADFLNRYKPTFEKSVFTVRTSAEEVKNQVTFAAGTNGSLEAYESTTSTQEIASPELVSKGSTVFFSPEADEGFTVSKWTINDTEVTQEAIDAGEFLYCGSVRFSGNGLIVEGIQSDIHVTVEFTNLTYTVRFSGDGGSVTAIQGTTTLSSPVEVCGGTSITFTAAPEEGKVVKSWQVTNSDGSPQTKKNPDSTDYTGTTLTLENINDNLTVQVAFEDAADPFTVTYSAVDENGKPTDGGLVSFTTEGLGENGKAQKASTVKLTASTKPGTAILRWEVYDGNAWVTVEANGDTYTIYSLQADTSVRVVTRPSSIKYTVTYVIPSDAGTLTARTGERDLDSGSSCTAYASVVFTYVESEAYEFVGWDVTGTTGLESSNGTTHTYTISALNADTTVKVDVRLKPIVRFNANGGIGSMDAVTVASGSYTLPECGFTAPEGKKFKGWATSENGAVISESTITITEDTTLYAVWEDILYTVSFDANGGGGSMDAVTVVSGNSYTLPECEFTAPEGKKFKGWATSENSAVISETTITVTKDTTLYAVWEDILYTVSFDANGGNGSMDAVTVVSGNSYTLPECGFTAPEGKQFKGWATSENGEVISDTAITVTGDTTLYAVWENIPVTTYTVSFDANGGTGEMAAVTVTSGESYDLPECGFTAPEGKQFKGWATSENGEVISDTAITVTGDITLYAVWEDIPVTTYTVRFDANGGTGEMADVTVTSGKSYDLPECGFTAPEGKQFKGWATSENGEVISDTAITVTGDTTLYAIWENIPVTTYTVSFDANGGTGEMADVTVTSGESYDLPECGFTAPEGKQFKGWATSENGEVISDTAITVTGDITLYAVWEDIPVTTYTVSFDANGGTGSMDAVTVASGESYDLPECGFTAPEGKQFKGWTTRANGQVISDDAITVTEDTTLYAVWEDIPVTTYTVSFDANGGTGSMDAATVVSGDSYTLPECGFTAPEGKQFKGWATRANGEVISKTAITVNGDITLYAVWEDIPTTTEPSEPEEETYTVSFDANGGSGSMDAVTVVSGNSYPLPDCGFTAPEGKQFKGWATRANGEVISKTAITVNGDITLYAVWEDVPAPTDPSEPEEETYTVRFEANGGTGEMADVTVTSGESYDLPECGFTAPEGKQFKGWATKANGEVISKTAITGNGDITLYAVWEDVPTDPSEPEKDTYTVSFDANGGSGSMDAVTVVSGNSYTLPDCGFTAPEGKQFKGWATKANGEVISKTAITVNGDITLYAVWEDVPTDPSEPEKEAYTVRFDANGGSSEMDAVTVVSGNSYTLPECGFTAPEGKQFKGWATSADGEVISDTTITVTENITLYAVWEDVPATTYTVRFDANGGSGSMDAVTVVSGDSYTLPGCGFTAPEGKQFKGWATSADGEVISDTTITVTENITLYAVWENIPATTYTVSFDANGGSGSMDAVTVVSGDSYTLPECGFTAPEVKQFKGWATSENGEVISDTTITVTEDITLYAVWEDVPAPTDPSEPESVPSTPVKPSWPSWMDKIFGGWWGDEEEACDHVYTSVVTEPTCEEKGYTTHTCEKCGDSYKDSYTDPLGHKWDEGTVTVEATCTEDGEKILACETCGKTKAEKIDALGHNFEDGVCTQCGAEDASEPENPGKPSWDNIWDWISGWWK